MTAGQRIRVRLSEVRERLNTIAGLSGDDLTAEVRSESEALHNEYGDLELRHRAAIVAEGEAETGATTEPDAEERERRELRSRARVSDFVVGAVTERPVTGASAEFADALGVAGYMPFDLLNDAEERAVTPGPSAESVTVTRPTIPAAFARTDAAALGVSMPLVPGGESHFVNLTTAPPAGFKAKDADADSTAAAFSLTKRTPGRITGQFVVRLEDMALLPSMETDLRRGIASRMADSLDKEVIDGDGSAPNLSGLFNQATDVTADTEIETFAKAVARYAALVEGTHANGWGDLRALIGPPTFARLASQFQSNGDMSVFDYLAGKLGLLRVSTRVPAVASMAQKGVVVRMAQGQPVSVPMWKGVEMIVDRYTQAAKGQRLVTAVSLVGDPFIPYGTSQVIETHPKIAS